MQCANSAIKDEKDVALGRLAAELALPIELADLRESGHLHGSVFIELADTVPMGLTHPVSMHFNCGVTPSAAKPMF